LCGERQHQAIPQLALIDWWEAEIVGKGRSVKTGRNDLDPLAGVFRMAAHLELIDGRDNPVPRLEGEVPADFLARWLTLCTQSSVCEN
jgi:hypothetical protein